jgi:hypothetical protein
MAPTGLPEDGEAGRGTARDSRGTIRRLLRVAIGTALGVVVVFRLPAYYCERRADAFFHGDLEADRALARGARAWLDEDAQALVFHTGSPRFDGEWYLIVHMAAVLGFGQTALAHPELSADHAALVTRACERILLPRGRAHDVDAWAEDPLDTLDQPPDAAHPARGHLAFLGYANLALSMQRRLDIAAPSAPTNDAITEALAQRYAASDQPLLESYPGETYPADNAAAVASIILHDRATGSDHSAVVDRVLAAMRERYTDRASGLMYQRVDSQTGEPRDGARASGTAMAAFVLGYAGADDPWWPALARQWDTDLGFGGVREYPAAHAGHGDVDSGPVIFGIGVSATAFAMAAASRHGDLGRYRTGFASAWLFGLPREGAGGALRFAAGGSLGDVLLFAVLTARGPS